MSDRYILVDGHPVEEPDLIKWGRWMDGPERIVRQDAVGSSRVSTVFLGLDHSFGDGPPVLWETMVFGGPLNDEQRRYTTAAAALAGHEEMVRRVTLEMGGLQ